jgi:hypothetical protein
VELKFLLLHHRGNLLVIAEKSLADSISNDLTNYLKDLAADGWNVNMIQVLKTDSIQKVKREIKNHNQAIGDLKTIIFIGHVPVPYSGNYSPDGHSEHAGCWPTDAYYAIDYDQWSDEEINSFGIARSENVNLPGDGKWDNNILPAKVNYYSGRIDLSNMPTFSKNEAQLTSQYFNKNHNYRYKTTVTADKGIIEDNFTTTQGAYSSAAWRGFSVLFGPKNIEEGDFLTKCKSQNYIFGFGAGAGTYTSCGGIANTDSFKTKKAAIFNMFFGSYFGDWDNSNNFLRAPLASEENGLTVAWSGRPYWQNHPMALGEPIGYCVALTQNNQGTYRDNSFGKTVHIGLMGDPTLRLNYFAPPDSLTASLESSNSAVRLNWEASSDSNTIGYYVYRSQNELNNSTPINSTLITGLTFLDNTPAEGTNYYLVKALKLSITPSGSYYNLSQGVEVVVSGITPNTKPIVRTRNSTLFLDASGSATLLASSVDSGSTANYTIDSYILSKSIFSCSDIGVNTITLTVTDVESNSNSGQALITVLDTISPKVLTKNISINLTNGSLTLSANDIDNGSYDNCAIANSTVSPSNFNCTHSGAQIVTLTITDVNGNVSEAQAIVTILSKPEVNISVSRSDNTFTGGNATTIYLGYGAQKVNLNVETNIGSSFSYNWSPGTNLNCTSCSSPKFSPQSKGNYTCSVIVTNNFGCSTTAAISLCVLDIRAKDCDDDDDDDDDEDDDDNKVLICHKATANSLRAKTIEISRKAVAAHLKKYPNDQLGRCGDGCNLNKMNFSEPEEIIEFSTVICSPNPYNQSFKLKFDRDFSESANLIIHDLSGKQIQKYNLENDEDVYGENLPSGMYLATFNQGSFTKTFRLIKID